MLNLLLLFINDMRFRRFYQAQEDLTLPDENVRLDHELMMTEILEEEEARYMHDVDHGWEEEWEAQYWGDGP